MVTASEKEKILNLWNKFYRYDPTTIYQLNRKYFENKYVDIIGKQSNKSAFSLLCKKNGKFNNEDGKEDKEAWIFSAGYTQKEQLIELLYKQIELARNLGIKKINYSNFSPGYFYPGLDSEKYPELYNLMNEIGFSTISTALSMEAEIGEMQYELPKANDLEIGNLKMEDKEEFLAIVKNNFPFDCYLRIEGVIRYGSIDQIAVAKYNNEIAGYSMYASGEGPFEYSPGERFGCFEVLEKYRSLGIGSRLLIATLINMKANGIRHTYFLWTTEKASHLYKRHGFRITRRFQIMSLLL